MFVANKVNVVRYIVNYSSYSYKYWLDILVRYMLIIVTTGGWWIYG